MKKLHVVTRITDYGNEEYAFFVGDEEIFSYGDPEYNSDGEDMLASILHLCRSLGVEYTVE